MAFTLGQIAYWLALSTWFGGVLFFPLAPPIILSAVRESNPVLPTVLSVNLEGQHGTLLGGSIVGKLMQPLMRLELVSAAVLLVALIAQWIILRPAGPQVLLPLLRSAMYLGAAGFLVYDWRIVWPKILKYRQEYIDHADEPDVANPALDQFDRYQAESLMVLRNTLFLLMGMILFSANIVRTITLIPST